MTYDEGLAQRVRELVGDGPLVSEKRMFGGLAFLVGGNLAVAASGEGGLLLRCAPEDTASLVGGSVSRAVMRGREMAGWLRVDGAALDDDAQLRRLVAIGTAYAGSLPPK
ncbi:TfoX/Sxy family protein [Calidifontibacter sp. DB0510]|uniref:TfoX/Sxy family protein n=1 Tax=Metallococcus carri TaxID=1656884 RepID=A0A967EG79_9MICO|nr:TfoX/Sxy family protein [Metallococcus carri]NHN57316.1 TfoX/Sxy family protein [Metallococcus carri]NOP38079.1 RNA methyltransferase [Calidifontibacter sp. DB2511S]